MNLLIVHGRRRRGSMADPRHGSVISSDPRAPAGAAHYGVQLSDRLRHVVVKGPDPALVCQALRTHDQLAADRGLRDRGLDFGAVCLCHVCCRRELRAT